MRLGKQHPKLPIAFYLLKFLILFGLFDLIFLLNQNHLPVPTPLSDALTDFHDFRSCFMDKHLVVRTLLPETWRSLRLKKKEFPAGGGGQILQFLPCLGAVAGMGRGMCPS